VQSRLAPGLSHRVAIAIFLLATSCLDHQATTLASGTRVEVLSLPRATYTSLDWLDDRTLVITASRGIGPTRLVRAEIGGTTRLLTPRWPTWPNCDGVEYSEPAVLETASIAALISCRGSPGGQIGPWRVVELDTETGNVVRTIVGPSDRHITVSRSDEIALRRSSSLASALAAPWQSCLAERWFPLMSRSPMVRRCGT
jgi:hypothetical protein